MQTASQEFISPQNTNLLVGILPQYSAWHLLWRTIPSAGSHLRDTQNIDGTERQPCFPLGSHVFLSLPLWVGHADLAPGSWGGLSQECIPFLSTLQLVHMWDPNKPPRLNLGLLLELLGVAGLLEYKTPDFSVLRTHKLLFAEVGLKEM